MSSFLSRFTCKQGRGILGLSKHITAFPCRHFGQPVAKTHPHLLQSDEVTPGITKTEYRNRRQLLMEHIAQSSPSSYKHHVVLIPSASKVYMTHDIPYTFRQNTDFLYFCGFMEPDSLLVLESDPKHGASENHRATLFVPKRDVDREMWDGPRSGAERAAEITGVDQAFESETIETFLETFIKERRDMIAWYDYKKPPHALFHMKYMSDFLKSGRLGRLESPVTLFHNLRLVKSPSEVELMRATCRITSESFAEVMKYSKSKMVDEGLLYAKMDFECRLRGANYLAYPPVVAGGNRANTIHYIANNQLIQEGELVLMDAGCEYNSYCGDVTRTWPITGEFTPVQRSLYEALLEVQKECIDLCRRSDMSLSLAYTEMILLIGRQLRRLGLIPPEFGAREEEHAARQFCPHHVGHYLGMDVHDTDEVTRSRKFQPGMIVTIEPGIYIPQSRTDVPQEFRGIGMRIEDDVLITEEGPVVLTSKCPKELSDVERTVRGET